MSSSIVDIENLAGMSTERTFAIVDQTPSPGLFGYDGVTVELWDTSCHPVDVPASGMSNTRQVIFQIPANTKWMTVVPGCYWLCFSIGGVALRWELR